jgi:hypothetical protein
MSLNSEFDEILKVFVYVDQKLLQPAFFTSLMAAKEVKDWHSFCRAMQATIAEDDQLMNGLFPPP